MPGSKVTTANQAQEQAIGHGTGPLRIQAGAGSGKTSTLVRRISSLVERGLCRPGQILMLTFTNKAVADMRAKVQAALAGGPEQPVIETYHAFAYSLVREFGHYLDLPPEPVLLTEGPLRLFLRQRFDRLGITRWDLTKLDAAVEKLLTFFEWHRHEGTFREDPATLLARLTPTADDAAADDEEGDDPDQAALLQELLAAHDAYRALLRECGAVDYGDLIALAVQLLEEQPEVAAQVHQRFAYLLVDEYQDTDHLQSRLIRLLTGAAAAVTIVGDPDQSIYSFRGAAMSNILDFHEDFPGTADVSMVTNYRSTPEIVAAANAVIQHNSRGKHEQLVAHRPAGEHPRPQVVQAPDWPTEARWLAQEAQRLHQVGYAWRDLAVLVRKNKLTLNLYASLLEAGVPAQVVGGLDLFADPGTRRFAGCLRALAIPTDDQAVAMALTMPRYGLTDDAVARLSQLKQPGESLLDAAVRRAGDEPALRRFTDEFWPLYRRQFTATCQEVIREALDLHGPSLGPEARAGARQLVVLSDGLLAHPELFASEAQGSTLLLFCEYLEALRSVDGLPEDDQGVPDQDAVCLMTVHSAKGLEYPVVFLPRLTDADFAPSPRKAKWDKPFPLAWHHDADIAAHYAEHMAEEERRLFYVAVTRAMDRLYLSWAPVDPGRKKPLGPSPFLAEAAAACEAVELSQAGLSDGGIPAVAAPEPGATEVAAGATDLLDRLVSSHPAAALPPPPAGVLAQLEAPPVLSYSHLHTYQLCPYRFFLQFLLRLPGRPNPAADDGVRVHAAIEQAGLRAATGGAVSYGDMAAWAGVARPVEADATGLAAVADDGLVTELEPAVGSHATGGTCDTLVAYLQSEYAATPPLASEQEFHLRLGGAVIRGFIDRIHRRADGTVEVVDFKTYNRLMTDAEVHQGLQLPLYIAGCRQALGMLEVDTGVLFFLKHNQPVRVQYTDAELAERLARAEALVRGIQAGKWDATPGGVCRYCAYSDECPATSI